MKRLGVTLTLIGAAIFGAAASFTFTTDVPWWVWAAAVVLILTGVAVEPDYAD